MPQVYLVNGHLHLTLAVYWRPFGICYWISPVNRIQNVRHATAKHVQAADRIGLVDAVFVNVCTVHAASL